MRQWGVRGYFAFSHRLYLWPALLSHLKWSYPSLSYVILSYLLSICMAPGRPRTWNMWRGRAALAPLMDYLWVRFLCGVGGSCWHGTQLDGMIWHDDTVWALGTDCLPWRNIHNSFNSAFVFEACCLHECLFLECMKCWNRLICSVSLQTSNLITFNYCALCMPSLLAC